MDGFKKFPSLNQFSNVYKNQQRFDLPATVWYGAKIKLHGTNAAVRVNSDGLVVAQSRSRDLTLTDDNAGFAQWVNITKSAWAETNKDSIHDEIIFFGEWAGKGIQKVDAVTQLNDKYFFIFAIQYGDQYMTTPADIEELIPDLDNVIVLPWFQIFEEPIDFTNGEQCKNFADMLDETVKKIEERDPFIYDLFGIDGPGEGWVISPVCNPGTDPLEGKLSRDLYSMLTFKVKVEGHKVKKGPSASKVMVVPDGAMEFVDMFVTEPRCEQGVTEALNGDIDIKRMGEFLKWMAQDIIKESVDELEDSGLTWKEVQKYVITAARQWFQHKVKEI